MVARAADDVCDCLRTILASLEKGDAVEAAQCLPRLRSLIDASPTDCSVVDVSEAKRLLERCCVLERDLRVHVLESMRQLGAVRKSAAYRRLPGQP